MRFSYGVATAAKSLAIALFFIGGVMSFSNAANAAVAAPEPSATTCASLHLNGHPKDTEANKPSSHEGTCYGSSSQNGRTSEDSSKPCGDCVGHADDKNPYGHRSSSSDKNKGYECDTNHVVGRDNPGHSGCTTTTTAMPTTTTTAAPTTTTVVVLPPFTIPQCGCIIPPPPCDCMIPPTTTSTTTAPVTTTTTAAPVVVNPLGTTTTTAAPSGVSATDVLSTTVSAPTTSSTTTAPAAVDASHLARTGSNTVQLLWLAAAATSLGMIILLAGSISRQTRRNRV